MRAHWAYFCETWQHKWFVLLAGLKVGVPIWQLLIHDWVKFLPIEWGPYVHAKFEPGGTRRVLRDASGAYNPAAQSEAFQRALHHHLREKHHPEAWVLLGRDGTLKPQPIPERYLRETAADWMAMARARGNKSALEYYEAEQAWVQLMMHPESARKLGVILWAHA